MSQDYGKIWEASLVYDLFIGIQLVRIFSSMLQQGEVNLEKSAITLKYAMDAKRICKFWNNSFLCRISSRFSKNDDFMSNQEKISHLKDFHFWHITFRRPRVLWKVSNKGWGRAKIHVKSDIPAIYLILVGIARRTLSASWRVQCYWNGQKGRHSAPQQTLKSLIFL